MPQFLNLRIDGKTNLNLFKKHLLFNFIWVTGVLIVLLRLDVFIGDKYFSTNKWLRSTIPVFFWVGVLLTFYKQKWYYSVALIFYPILMVSWFIPKTILRRGKIFLLGNYLNSMYLKIVHWKQTIVYLIVLVVTIVVFLTVQSNWAIWLSMVVFSFFYFRATFKLTKRSFDKPSLFGKDFEQKIHDLVNKTNHEDSLIVKSYIVRKTDENLEVQVRLQKQVERGILAHHVIQLISRKLNSFKSKRAFLITLLFGAFKYLFYSIVFFWFINYQLYVVNNSNFLYSGSSPIFDFFYYTIKTITFGDIELVKPVSIAARLSEMCSFAMIGIFILVIVLSSLFSLKQEKMSENVKLTTELFESETSTLFQYFKDQYGMELLSVMKDFKNIDASLKNLKKTLDKLF